MSKSKKKRNAVGKFGNISRTGDRTLTTFGVGGLPIVNHFLERADMEGFLRVALGEDKRCKISPEIGILTLVRNYLLSRQPIYGVGEWARGLKPALLQLDTTQLRSLNDDRVGRCLDRLFAADCPALVLALTRHVVEEFDLDLSEIHNDTTTISFYGNYVEPTVDNVISGKWKPIPAYGHSKDHRPDLKQLLYNLTVSSDGAVPVAFGVESGNVTDDSLHQKTWDLICEIVGGPDFLYVADSKLATRDNMAYIANRGGRFISVLPRTRSEDGDFRRRVVRDEISWEEVRRKADDLGKVVDVISAAKGLTTTTSEGYRLLWFRSTRKAELDLAARANSIRRAIDSLDELQDKLRSPRTRYRDESKVLQEVDKRLRSSGAREWITYSVTAEEEEKFVQRTAGRPGPSTDYRRKTRLRFRLTSAVDTEKTAEAARHDGVFPLVTNERKLSAREILEAYKRQADIEKRFSQLKTQFQIAPVFLKSTTRIVALLTVYYLALLIQALTERELRREMKNNGVESLPLYPEDRKCKAPTTRRVLDYFDNIERHELRTSKSKEPTIFTTELSELQSTILELLQVSEEDYSV